MQMKSSAAFQTGEEAGAVAFLWFIATIVAAVSLAYTGFEFGISNNVFHIPFVLSLDRLPQFQSNEFYSTLKYFTSAVWFTLRLLADESNIEIVFFAAHVLARFGTVFAMLYLARELGLTDRFGLLLVSMGVVLSPHLLGAYVGGHDLLNEYFTHTAMTWPFLLMALADSQSRRFHRAALFAGLVFLVNAFVGIWLAAALTAGAIFNWQEHRRQDWWQLPGIFLLVCAPVLVWIQMAMGSSATLETFNFRDYIDAYFSGHFVVDWTDVPRLLEAAAIFAVTIWCAIELGKRRLAWTMGGFVAIVAAGIVLPYVDDSRLMFNLHLLRAAGVLQFVFPLFALVVAWRRWLGASWIERMSAVLIGVSVINGMSAITVLAGLALPICCTTDRMRLSAAIALAVVAAWLGMAVDGAGQLGAGQFVGLYCASAMLLFDMEARYSARAFWMTLATVVLAGVSIASALELHAGLAKYRNLAALLLVWGFMLYDKTQWLRVPDLFNNLATVLSMSLAIQMAGAAITIVKRKQDGHQELIALKDYFSLVDWLKAQPSRGPLLVPLELKNKTITDRALFRYNLQLFSRQPVWVDWKQGAAVMWQPAFHSVWRPRYEGVKQLESPNDYYRYAVENRIRWMVLNDGVGPIENPCPGTGDPPIFSQGRYRVCLIN